MTRDERLHAALDQILDRAQATDAFKESEHPRDKAGMFKPGDWVKRKPVGKVKMDNPQHHHGRVLSVSPGKTNQGKPTPGYYVQTKQDLAMLGNNNWKHPDTGEQPDKWDLEHAKKGTWFAHSELAPLKE